MAEREVKCHFEDKLHPGFIKLETISSMLLLCGVNSSFNTKIQQILALPKRLDEYSLAELSLDLQSYAANTATFKQPPTVDIHPSSNQQVAHGALLSTAQPRPPSAYPAKPPSPFSPTHPHSRLRGPSTGPGNPQKPHCPHCFKNGWIFNNHNCLGASNAVCGDLDRATRSAPPAPVPNTTTTSTTLSTAHQSALAARALATYLAETEDIVWQAPTLTSTL